MLSENGRILNDTDIKQCATLKLSWKNITLWYPKKVYKPCLPFRQKGYVKVLNNVNGVVYSGTLMGIMGASGSGKTSLLTALSQRSNGVIVGEIMLNDNCIAREQMKLISGFVPQQELFVGDLTVTEHLQFMARLKMHKTATVKERNETTFLLLSQLCLTEGMQKKISLLSGGEIKKLSLAVQLLTNPPLLFCDEPTTGLDSYNAESVVKILNNIAELGKIVICTIHQPKSGIFDMFHQITFLACGSMIYCGTVDDASSYFQSLDLKCPEKYNPPEFYISQLAMIEKDAIAIQNLCDYFQNSPFSKEMRKYLNKKHNSSNKLQCTFGCTSLDTEYVNNYPRLLMNKLYSFTIIIQLDFFRGQVKFFVQVYWLLWRCFQNMKLNYKNILLRFFLYMFIASLLSTMYWNLTATMDQEDVQNLEGLIYLIITETIFTFTYSVLHTFPDELPAILREISDGLYSPGPYYISKMVSLIPFAITETICYTGIICWSIGLKGGVFGYIYFYLPVLFCAIASMAYGFALSTTFESVGTASLVSVPIDFIAMIYSGIYINISQLPWYTAWLPYISQFYFGSEAISVAEWEKIDAINCENPNLPCITTGKNVLEKYGYQFDNYRSDLFGLILYCIICHVIGFLSFRRRCISHGIY